MPLLSPEPGLLRAIALMAVHVAIASAVTVHALLYKRDPRAAVAWIGLAWLSPAIGSVLYLLLGINRVRGRARQLRSARGAALTADYATIDAVPAALRSLARAGGRLTDRQVVGGNSIALLQNGDAAYPLMLTGIADARSTVALSSFIFRNDVCGREFIGELAAAQRRGVEVRVLIDGIGGGYVRAGAWRELTGRGVRAARFLHSMAPWRMPFLNLRNHRKLLVIDGTLAFTGGLNIGDENVVARGPAEPVRDTHFRIEGPIVAELTRCFIDDWLFTTGENLGNPRWFPDLAAAGSSLARAVTSGPDQDLEKIELLIIEAVSCARRSIRIMTPYFLPDNRLITALSLASFRGVEISIVLPQISNHHWMDWANRAHIEPLLAAGVEIYTQAAPFNHSKLLAIDGSWCLIGSANWDTRSFRLNFELTVEVYDAALAAELEGVIRSAQQVPLTLNQVRSRPLARKLRDSAARLLSPYL